MTENQLSYETPEPARGRERLARSLGMAACAVGLIGTWVGLKQALRMLDYPVGSEISFFSPGAAIDLGRLVGLAVALPLGVLGTIFGWRRSTRWLGLVGILLALASIFLAGGLCDWIVSNRKLVPFRWIE